VDKKQENTLIGRVSMTTLHDFTDLFEKDGFNEYLLFGNGLSIHIYPKFKYASLLEECKRKKILDDRTVHLFGKLDTTNFETVLTTLDVTRLTNRIFGIDCEPIRDKYDDIRSALIKTIRSVHPHFDEVDVRLSSIGTALSRFKKGLFTTNYDLLPYWSSLGQKTGCLDFFYRSQRHEQLNFTPHLRNFLHNGQTRQAIYYLHGALHIFQRQGKVYKMEKGRRNLLSQITAEIERNNIPLFVSEGSWQHKEAKISSNVYLNFCFETFQRMKGQLVIFGHSLTEDSDFHIVQAINRNEHVHKIAYGIYAKEKDDVDIAREVSRIKCLFKEKEVVFFDSESFFTTADRQVVSSPLDVMDAYARWDA
jgi:hypothetical protein